MFIKLTGLLGSLMLFAYSGMASAAIIQYNSFADFQSTTTTSDVGGNIYNSSNYSTNSTFATNSGDPGGVTPNGTPMEFSGISAFEVGMIFGNDQNCCGSNGLFDATISVFSGATLLGSVIVATNGNDLADQFIGLGSDAAFDKVTLSYGSGSGSLSQFINRIDIGYDEIASVPEPTTLALMGLSLAGIGFARKKKQS